jgi:hypothetical protein
MRGKTFRQRTGGSRGRIGAREDDEIERRQALVPEGFACDSLELVPVHCAFRRFP